MKFNKNRLILWVSGFVVLFLFNGFVEAVVLTYLDLHNTDKNDIYFKLWWVVVGIWLVFGNMILKHFEKK